MGQDVIARCHIADPYTRLKTFDNDPSLELSRPPPLAAPPRFDNLTPPHETIATVRHAQPPSAQADLLADAAGVRNSSIQWGVADAYIFLDETGTNTKMTREYGRSLRGQRLKGTAPFRRWGNQTLIAGLSCDGIVAPWVISGAMDRDAFDTYVEKVLIPELDPGSVVILDNLATHKSDAAA